MGLLMMLRFKVSVDLGSVWFSRKWVCFVFPGIFLTFLSFSLLLQLVLSKERVEIHKTRFMYLKLLV